MIDSFSAFGGFLCSQYREKVNLSTKTFRCLRRIPDAAPFIRCFYKQL